MKLEEKQMEVEKAIREINGGKWETGDVIIHNGYKFIMNRWSLTPLKMVEIETGKEIYVSDATLKNAGFPYIPHQPRQPLFRNDWGEKRNPPNEVGYKHRNW